MSRRQDPELNPYRRLFAVILLLTCAAGAIATLVGCAGINFRHMRVDGVTLPDALYTQFRRVAGPELIEHFGPNMQGYEIPRVVDTPLPYSRGGAYRQVRALALWSIAHGYKCEIWWLRRYGWAAHPVLAVTLDGTAVVFDPARHRIYTKLGKWKVLPFTMDEDEITHKGILEIGRQLCPTNQPNESKKGK